MKSSFEMLPEILKLRIFFHFNFDLIIEAMIEHLFFYEIL